MERRVAGLVVLGGAVLFAMLAMGVEVRPVAGVDVDLMRVVGEVRGSVGTQWMVAISALGKGVVMVVATLVLMSLLVMGRHRTEAVFLGLAVMGAMVISPAAKALVGRPRPEVIERIQDPSNLSFPSGHALSAMVFYTALALLAARLRPRWRLPTIALAAIMIPTMGFSRIYLGVHYPSDVLAGFALGASWVWGLWLWLFSSPARSAQ